MLSSLHIARANQCHNTLIFCTLTQTGGVSPKTSQSTAHTARIHKSHTIYACLRQHSWCCFFIAVHNLLQQYDKNNL